MVGALVVKGLKKLGHFGISDVYSMQIQYVVFFNLKLSYQLVKYKFVIFFWEIVKCCEKIFRSWLFSPVELIDET